MNTLSRADAILDRALELGESSGWAAVRLHTVSDALQLSLNDVRACFPQKDDLAEAWFDRADQAALEVRSLDGFASLSEQARLATVIMAWLDALATHRRLTREMLGYKIEPGHIHLQVLGLMRVSRTVQWFMEATQLNTTGLRRIATEISLTAIYLSTLARWLFDDSPGSRNTRHKLDAALQRQEQCLGRTCGRKPGGNPVETANS